VENVVLYPTRFVYKFPVLDKHWLTRSMVYDASQLAADSVMIASLASIL
jgi:hypothetical protein